MQEVLGDNKVLLAFNALGGRGAQLLSSCLATSGTMITYGATSNEPIIPIFGNQLILKDLRFCGFLLPRSLCLACLRNGVVWEHVSCVHNEAPMV